jgi:hypothetical protein
MGFVHLLDASGKYEGDMNGLMRHAEELTENSLTSFRKSDRPMIVNQLGATGSLAYTFKSYLFNEFNQLSQLARHGVTTGNYSALLSHLGMLTVVGGVLSVPAVNEMDGLWNLVKDFIAEHNPELYRFVKGNGLKASIIEHLPDFASYGLASSVTGASLQNRFGTDVADPEHPLKNIFPLGQDIKELASGIGGLTHPNKTTATEALYQQMPAIGKGQMEAHMDMFKGEHQKGGDVVMNPNNLLEHKAIDHLRTPEDWNYRKWGMTSLAEAKDRQTGYSNSEENGRIKTATDSLGRNLFDAILRKNPGDVTSEAASYLRLNPNEEALKADLDKRIMASSLTPTQQAMARAQTYQQIDSVIRLMKERGQR